MEAQPPAQQPSDATPAPTPSADAAAPAPAPAPAPAAAPKKPAFSKRTKLAQAVRQGQAGRVRLLVEQDMAKELKEQHPGAYTAMLRHYLGIAVAEGPDEGIIDYLLSKLPEGTRLNSIAAADRKDVESASHLMAVAEGKHGPHELRQLLEYKACPVYMAVCSGQHEERILRLLARPNDPADLPLAEEDGNRFLLHEACMNGMLAVVKALVAPPHSAPITMNDDGSDQSPLCWALKHNHADVVLFLCQELWQQYGDGFVRWVDNPMGPIANFRWAAAYMCLIHDALEALQALLKVLPDADAFFTSASPWTKRDASPVLAAARHWSLRCLKWLIESHNALRASPTPPPVLHALCRSDASETKLMAAIVYLVHDCGMDVDMLHENETAAQVAARHKATFLHDFLTRGKRAAAADEAADALLAELEAEEERKAREQQKKKGRKKGKAATTATGGEPAEREQQGAVAATVAAVEEATVQAAALTVGGGDEEQEDAAEVNPIEPQPVPASVVVEDRKISAPKPQPQQAAPRIPESEEAHSSKPTPAIKSSLAPPPPPSAAGGDCSPAKKAAVAAEDPREAAFLLKHARREDLCPLSGALLTDPVIASDGITYARAALEAYVAAAQAAGETLRSPITGELIASVIFPNVAVKRLVEHYVDEQRAEWRRPGRRPRRR